MLSTAVMGAFGFVFWLINARLFTPEQIGIGSTLISVISLIVTISLLGLNVGIIRFLPTSGRKNDKINTVFTITGLTAILVSTLFILTLNIFSPKLLFLKHNLYVSLFFIFSIVGMTLFTVIESICIAYRRNELILLKNTIFSIGKIILPFLLVSFGAMGIFGSWTISAIIGFLVVFSILVFKLGYVFEPYFYDGILKKIIPYSFGNYVAGFISALPLMLLPLIITNILSPEITAVYYISVSLALLVFNIPSAITNSLLAEGSKNAKDLHKITRKSIKLTLITLVPAVLFIIICGKFILSLYGTHYADNGFHFLQIMVLSSVFVAANYIMSTILRLKNMIKELILVNLFTSFIILALSILLMRLELFGIGISWVAGQFIGTILYFFILRRRY